MFAAVTYVRIGVPVEPSTTDVAVVYLVGLADGRQDSLLERRNRLHIRAEERLFALTGSQCGSVPLNRV